MIEKENNIVNSIIQSVMLIFTLLKRFHEKQNEKKFNQMWCFLVLGVVVGFSFLHNIQILQVVNPQNSTHYIEINVNACRTKLFPMVSFCTET